MKSKIYLLFLTLALFSLYNAESDNLPHTNLIIDVQNSSFERYLDKYDDNQHNSMEHLKMGKRSGCDNARMGIRIDFDPSDKSLEFLYKCLKESEFPVDDEIQPYLILYRKPEGYIPLHICINQPIEYYERIPTIGPHRPLWAIFGEYKYVPVQRWLHNIEHGSIIMLYNPCAADSEVNKLRQIVKSCIFRHVITPYPNLSKERPLALVTWAASLEMNKVDVGISKSFIRGHALKGPEKTSKNGQYGHFIQERARVVSDIADTELCPDKPRLAIKPLEDDET